MSHRARPNRPQRPNGPGLSAAQRTLAIPEIIHEIFVWIQVLRPKNRRKEIEPRPKRLLNCARVNRSWHCIASQIMWRKVTSLSNTFNRDAIRRSPRRQLFATWIRSAQYFVRKDFEAETGSGLKNKYLDGLSFSQLHTLTIQICADDAPSWETIDSDPWILQDNLIHSEECIKHWPHPPGCVYDMYIPDIKCPALKRLVLWHLDYTIHMLPEVWMSYLRRILSMAKSLEVLEISEIILVHSKSLDFFVRNAPKLRYVKYGKTIIHGRAWTE